MSIGYLLIMDHKSISLTELRQLGFSMLCGALKAQNWVDHDMLGLSLHFPSDMAEHLLY